MYTASTWFSPLLPLRHILSELSCISNEQEKSAAQLITEDVFSLNIVG